MSDKPTNKDGVTGIQRWDTFRAPGPVGWKTVSLFADVESCPDPDKAVFWLNRNKLGDDRPCFRDWFLHLEDITGNALANKFLGNAEHWDVMYNRSPWFRESVDQWRVELEGILRQKALTTMLDIMENGTDSQKLTAAKFLFSHVRDPDDEAPKKRKRGRPSKEEIEGHMKNLTSKDESTEEDYLKILNGDMGNA